MSKLTVKELTKYDLREIAVRLRKFSKEVIKVKVHASKKDILKICNDEPTHKHIDVINSASIDIDGVRFELVVSDKN